MIEYRKYGEVQVVVDAYAKDPGYPWVPYWVRGDLHINLDGIAHEKWTGPDGTKWVAPFGTPQPA